MTHDNSPPSDFGDDFDMSDPSGDGPTEPELTEAETIAAEDKVSGFVPSPELTAGQNAMLRRGDLPGEVKLEVIQTIGLILAFVMSIVSLGMAFGALGVANSAVDELERLRTTTTESVVETTTTAIPTTTTAPPVTTVPQTTVPVTSPPVVIDDDEGDTVDTTEVPEAPVASEVPTSAEIDPAIPAPDPGGEGTTVPPNEVRD